MATALATKAEFNAAMANAENKLCVIDFTGKARSFSFSFPFSFSFSSS